MRISYAIGALLALSISCQALVLVESIDGDLSNDNEAPTPLTFDVGVNQISGTMGQPDVGPFDPDFFTFTLSPGQALTSIFVNVFDPPNSSFYAVGPGSTINDTNPATHLSNVLINNTGEWLDNLDAGSFSGGTGLDAPLGPGTYTIWFQEVSSQVTYSIAYTVVPEPGTFVTLLGGAGMLLMLRGRRR